MELSDFGRKFKEPLGIGQLMADLGGALSSCAADVMMLGGGNPGRIPAVQDMFRRRMLRILETPGEFEHLIGDYDPPRGSPRFAEAVAGLLSREFGWPVTAANVALTNGSQNSFFYLFNMFAGRFGDGRRKRVLFPLTPEYIGYADVGLERDFFVANRPEIAYPAERFFKYRVDFGRLSIGDDIGAVCVSRPTNPTGNVITDGELSALSSLTRDRGVPLIVDNAYGTPFPHIVFEDVRPLLDEHIIVCMSLSKLGLPGLRTGIVIADEDVIRTIADMNAVFSLAPGGMGAALALELLGSGEILRLSREVIRPFYQRKAERAVAQLVSELDGVEFYIHKPEGAIFLWLWFPGLPVSDGVLYERLKQRGVIVVPGHFFFQGLREPWVHTGECIRVTYAQDDGVVARGLSIIAEEVRTAYGLPRGERRGPNPKRRNAKNPDTRVSA